ncbi:hypothetical protein BHE74_00051508 [Ensete ventricosum]|nr:hypothetical protein BHE74_00051508 [Ensete ventricosum]
MARAPAGAVARGQGHQQGWLQGQRPLVEGRRPQRHHLWAWRLPVHEVLLEGNSACHRGGRQRRDATACAGATTEEKGQQGLGFLFSGKGLFCPLNLRNFRSVILSRISKYP